MMAGFGTATPHSGAPQRFTAETWALRMVMLCCAVWLTPLARPATAVAQYEDLRFAQGSDPSPAERGCIIPCSGACTCDPGCPLRCTATCPVQNCSGGECGDPDCKPFCGGGTCDLGCAATRCSAACPGNLLCAPVCGGSACNLGCSPCQNSGCPLFCDEATCPGNVCHPTCPDSACNPLCPGGDVCNSGCPLRCTATCPTQNCSGGECGDPDCKPLCGGGPCDLGCDATRCSAACPLNLLCESICGGDSCNVGCSPCETGCPTECDLVLCPQNVVPCIWNLLNSVSTRVDTTVSRMTHAVTASEAVAQRVAAGVVALTGDLQSAVDGAVSDLKRIVAKELGGAEFVAFTDGPNGCSAAACEPFRQELNSLLLNFESAFNGVFSTMDLGELQLDLARMRGVISILPGRLLFPLYRVFKADNGDLLGTLSDLLGEIGADLAMVADIFVTEPPGTGTPVCTLMTQEPLLFEGIIIRNTTRAIALKVIAKIFEALGETTASGDAGVHGYVHLTYEDNFPKKFAAVIESLSGVGFYIAETVKAKLESCLTSALKAEAQVQDSDLLAGQTAILNGLRGNTDLNYDGETNLRDFAIFQRKFGLPGVTQP